MRALTMLMRRLKLASLKMLINEHIKDVD